MTNTILRMLPGPTRLNSCKRHQLTRLKQLRTAYRYLAGTLSKNDAEDLIVLCEPIAGWHPLVSVTVDDVMTDALETYADHPDLPRLVASACSIVGRKWDDCGETLSHAREWALELVDEMASQRGVALVSLDAETPEDHT